ncbi:MAG: hypothetical protein RSD09_06815 [Bacilli bacterium]
MKYAIDRIIDNIVVLENIETKEIINENIKLFPKKIYDGLIVIKVNNKYKIDKKEYLSRKSIIKEKYEKLKK